MEFDSKKFWVTMLGSTECLAADDVTIRCVSAELAVDICVLLAACFGFLVLVCWVIALIADVTHAVAHLYP